MARSDLKDLEEKVNEINMKFQELGGDIDKEMERTLKDYRDAIKEKSKEIYGTAKDKGKQVDVYVHEHPWQSVGIAFGAGLLIGWLARKD